MFGFVNYRKETRSLGSEVFKARQRRFKIFMGILGFIGFAILNLILYMMIKVNY